ncbi:and tpr domain containing protein [Niveomyces insectorum RCEF 264]|uniref:And tpr domain containing protein n=1 Tax=Niveomyces insectorum RCEF 264 TaxID=1081102 RepID=A0A162MD77_9HYPO|nr:and tpr domain containing protein [Niveomyces insectorum RCEF 264]
MLFRLSTLALAAGIASALSAQDIPADTPVASLLASAQSHLSRGETNDALVFYDAAVARDPTDYLTFFKRATTYLSLGRAAQATDDFHKVLALRPGFDAAYVQLGKIKQRVADWDGAREQFRAAKTTADAGALLAALDEAQAAAALAEKAERQPGGVEEGVGDLQHVLQLKPGDVAPHLVISAVNFYALGELDKGLAQVRKCLQSDPDSKACRALLRQEKAAEKTLAKVDKAFGKNQPSTGTKNLVPSGDNPGLIQEIKDEVQALRNEGVLPVNAPDGLLTRLVSLACQGYYEMNSKKAKEWCEDALQRDEHALYGLLYRHKTQLDAELFDAAVETLKTAKDAHPDKGPVIDPLMNEAQLQLRRSKTKDYYKVLGVSRDADERQIKTAYRRLTKVHHPDKAASQGLTKEDAEKKMAQINEAYEVLSDPELRARFDQGDDPMANGQQDPSHGSPFGGGHPFVFQQGGQGQQFKFQFGSGGFPGGFPFGG